MASILHGSKDIDLAGLYAQHMEHHGCGKGLFLPVSTKDLSPPCCGFFDRNSDWNLISSIEHNPLGSLQQNGFVALTQPLRDVTGIDIKWQPKTSTGVQEETIDTSAGTSTNVAGGADAHIKYSGKHKFGAVLITKHPVVLQAYHQERAFLEWLESNRRKLYDEYGTQLRKYGLWIITKTYSTHGASINAWYDDDKDVMISIAAKANMLGELKGTLDQTDKVMDKDWSHYSGEGPYTGTLDDKRIVIFADGIQLRSSYWWLKGLEYALPGQAKSKSSSPARPQKTASPITHKNRNSVIIPGSTTTNTQTGEISNLTPSVQQHQQTTRHVSDYRASTLVEAQDNQTRKEIDEDDAHLFADAFGTTGGLTTLSRAPSLRTTRLPSRSPSNMHSSSRTSLRRDSRDVSSVRSIEKLRTMHASVPWDTIQQGVV